MASPTDGNCKPRPRALLWRLRRLPELSQSCRRRDRDKYRQRSSRSSARDTAHYYTATDPQRPNSWHVTITNIGLVDRRKYLGDQINCQLPDSLDIGYWIIGSKQQILFTVCISACELIKLFLLSTSDSLARLCVSTNFLPYSLHNERKSWYTKAL